MDNARKSLRYPVPLKREGALCIIPFKTLVCTVLGVRILDISKNGVGIESDSPLEPGFIWFKDRIAGFKGGVLVWARRADGKYRAGIRFVPLSRHKELLVQERLSQIRPDEPLRDPGFIISTILDAMTLSGVGTPGMPLPAAPDAAAPLSDEESGEDLIAQLRTLLSSL